ncbi:MULTISPECIES: GNAT family N-acetyltransferase [unclassified Enterococcus]|uniref:GNAT family N-acetyltransferase n=1 Tax=unclassified Enterococcus TaxID=2608891 RepID=UPI002B4BD9B4|nr:GNAT family N-acetyltransferase [Enterococcus sp. CWB-B31]
MSYLKKNKPACTIRSFKPEDAEAVSRLLKRNFLEINSQFYPMEQMELLVEKYSAQAVIKQASCAHTYVAELGDTLIGTATICPYFNSLTESIILSVFILPEYQQNGIGTSLLKRLKTDPFYIRASRIEVLASRNAQNFYSGFGFKIKNPAASENTQGYVVMEKHRKK